MAEGENSVSRGSAYIRSFVRSLELRFTRHEAWALNAARQMPIFSLFAFGTLCLWFFVPCLPISFFFVLLLENAGVFGAIAAMVAGVSALVAIGPWFFQWYFICLGLMFGRSGMAQAKAGKVASRLARLQSTLP